MAFVSRQLSASSGFGGAACGEYFTYRNLNDTVAQITASDYFGTPIRSINTGDLIYVQASDANVFLRVIQVSPSFTTEIFYADRSDSELYMTWAVNDITDTVASGSVPGPSIMVPSTAETIYMTCLQNKTFISSPIQIGFGITRGPGVSFGIGSIQIFDNTSTGTPYIEDSINKSTVFQPGDGIRTTLDIGTPGEGMAVAIGVKMKRA